MSEARFPRAPEPASRRPPPNMAEGAHSDFPEAAPARDAHYFSDAMPRARRAGRRYRGETVPNSATALAAAGSMLVLHRAVFVAREIVSRLPPKLCLTVKRKP